MERFTRFNPYFDTIPNSSETGFLWSGWTEYFSLTKSGYFIFAKLLSNLKHQLRYCGQWLKCSKSVIFPNPENFLNNSDPLHWKFQRWLENLIKMAAEDTSFLLVLAAAISWCRTKPDYFLSVDCHPQLTTGVYCHHYFAFVLVSCVCVSLKLSPRSNGGISHQVAESSMSQEVKIFQIINFENDPCFTCHMGARA